MKRKLTPARKAARRTWLCAPALDPETLRVIQKQARDTIAKAKGILP